VFEEKKKELVRVLTTSYLESESKFDELISGKGWYLGSKPSFSSKLSVSVAQDNAF
jgi:hypothetical protein